MLIHRHRPKQKRMEFQELKIEIMLDTFPENLM